ncbi:hypothetical protein ZEAMMB73_Zm00001d012478 [Zea mays]|uniref:Uncharacterized protein n=1 Tax=Zea mays TaxID=4577 RepID=A0A1D6G903_MAIZE|nr:hypothetical protein ZEAMMB73_Zm00001d012478 [Zea mays]
MDVGSSERAQDIAQQREGMLRRCCTSSPNPSTSSRSPTSSRRPRAGAAEPKLRPAPKTEGKDRSAAQPAAANVDSEESRAEVVGGGSFHSINDGVLLTFYMSRAPTWSFIVRLARTPSSASICRSPNIASDCSKR